MTDKPANEPKPEIDTKSWPQLKLIAQAIGDAGLTPTEALVRQFRTIAKSHNLCFVIARRVYVDAEQMTKLLDLYRWQYGHGEKGPGPSWLKEQRMKAAGARQSGFVKTAHRRALEELLKPSKKR